MQNKNKKIWLVVAVGVFAMVFLALYFVFKLNATMPLQFENISGFAFLGVLVSAVVCGAGYLGKKHFFAVAFASNLVGLVAMLLSATLYPQADQHALGSVLLYVLIFIFGLIIAACIQHFAGPKKT